MNKLNSPFHILVVDDDSRIRSLLSAYLNEQGFRVSIAENAEDAEKKLKGLVYDLIILDVMMPGKNGYEFLKGFRLLNSTPVLMLTARGEVEDRITGLEKGADDYIVKPFEPKELLLRINNIIKRQSGNKDKIAGGEVAFGPYRYHKDQQQLFKDGEMIHLTTAEQVLLDILIQKPGTVFSREHLMELSGFSGELRTIDVSITRLRRKIEDNPRFPRYLQTVRNKGYILKTG